MKIVIRDDEKKDKAVSAIIGTILIVAITVVLAATLYAVLGGFSGLIGKPTPTASMSISTVGSPSSGGYYELTFTSVSSNISLANTQLKVTTATGTTTTASFVPATTSPTTSNGTYDLSSPLSAYVGNSGEYLTFNTVITIHGASLSAVYLIDTQTGGTIASVTNI
jgi:flagellin-like protein